jgi:LytS/YehU family sensor histidine kinase
MKNRNEEAVSVSLDIDDSLLQFHLPTLALQTVVENCFKHNSMTSKKPLHIEINNTDDFYLRVKNNIQPKIGDNTSTGYGLESLKKRYELMNIKRGVLIEETPDYFIVKLKLL